MMENEILKEVWQTKETIAAEHENDLDSLAKSLREKERRDKEAVVDLSRRDRDAA